jgi:hypothetical protein
MTKRILLALLATAFFAVAHAQAPKPGADAKPAADPPHVKIIQEIFNCLSGGLKPEWKLAWVNVLEISRSEDGKSRNFEANLRYTTKQDDTEGEPLKPCDSSKIVQSVGDLNEFLKLDERAWTAAQLVFSSDGQFEVKYDYTPTSTPAPAPAAAKPGATPAAKPAAKPGAGFKLKSQ